jgi:hypothetical protein
MNKVKVLFGDGLNKTKSDETEKVRIKNGFLSN